MKIVQRMDFVYKGCVIVLMDLLGKNVTSNVQKNNMFKMEIVLRNVQKITKRIQLKRHVLCVIKVVVKMVVMVHYQLNVISNQDLVNIRKKII